MQERFVVHITDVLAVSMMLGITAQVKEAGIAWDKGEKKSKDRARRDSRGPGRREQGAGVLLGLPALPPSLCQPDLDPGRRGGRELRAGAPVTCVSLSDLEVLRSFQNQIAAIQRDAVWWLHTVVPSISKMAPKDYVHWCGLGRAAPLAPGGTAGHAGACLSPWMWPLADASLRGASGQQQPLVLLTRGRPVL